MKRKILFLLVSVLLPLTASAYDVCIDGIYYNVVKKAKQATVTYGENQQGSYSGSVEIPATIDYDGVTCNVVAIGDNAFCYCYYLTSVTIPNSVTTIGNDAFYKCNGLTSVHISDIAAWCNISFGSNPLGYAHHLYMNGQEVKDLVIPNSVTTIGNAFAGCSGLTSVTIPNSVTSIGGGAFSNCSGLTSVTIPNSVTSIGNRAFNGCSGLTSITIPNSVTSIGDEAFSGCKGLTSFTIPNTVTSIGESTFKSCSGLTSITIPNSVTSIGNSAFSSCSGLSSVTIPNSVTSIGNSAFSSCSGLSSVTIPNSVTYVGRCAFQYCSSLTSITIPNSVTSIDVCTFYYCSSLTSVTIGNSVTTIDSYSFQGCSALTSVTIGNSVASINSYAFYDCSSLTSITIPNSVTTISTQAFNYCRNLATITIGNGIKKIDYQAFANCEELSDVYCYAEAVPSTYSGAFENSLIEYATLHVPSASIDLYSAANIWKDFKNIVALQNGDPGTIVQGIDINDINFPDAVFREYVGGNTIDKDQSGKLSEEEMGAVTTIDVNNLQISDLKGIEFFTALTTLSCRFTKLKSIDLSKNTALVDLDCRNNSFTTLDVSKNTELVNLKCARNWITSLDVSNNTKLNMLRCNYNRLTSLDVSKCTKLQRFDCYGNKIGKTAMGNLVASLPSGTNGRFYVIDTTLGTEENVCTTDHVAAAKAKGWTVYDYHDGNSVEYTGSSETVPGDLSGDGELNGTDLVMLTNLILNGQMNTVADLNGDGQVNGTDYVLMVNRILGITSAPMMLAPAMDTTTEANLSIEDFTIEAGETKEMIIDLTNYDDQMTLVQFDLRLPEGLSIVTDGIEIAGRTTWQEHLLYAHDIGNVTRVFLASARNAEISGNSGALISIRLTASDKFDGGDIVIGNTLLVTPRANETQPIDYIYHINGTTGIRSLTPTLSQGKETYYDLSGRPVTNPSKGIYIVNGKRIIINNK